MKKLLYLTLFLLFSSSVSAESIIYIFDSFTFAQMDDLKFNGTSINLPAKIFIKKDGAGFDKYRKSVTKCIIKNDGKLIISRDLTWYNKPYHDEVTFDLTSGDTYYIDLLSGSSNKIKIMSEKDGLKNLEKARKKPNDWTFNSDLIYEN